MPTPVIYPQFKLKQLNGNGIDLDTDTIKVMIVTSAYTPADADDFIDDADANEVSGTNYIAGGTTVAGVTLALDGTVAEFAHNDVVWAQSGSGFSNGRFFIWYHDTGTPATSKIIQRLDNTSNFGNIAGTLTLDTNAATGVLQAS